MVTLSTFCCSLRLRLDKTFVNLPQTLTTRQRMTWPLRHWGKQARISRALTAGYRKREKNCVLLAKDHEWDVWSFWSTNLCWVRERMKTSRNAHERSCEQQLSQVFTCSVSEFLSALQPGTWVLSCDASVVKACFCSGGFNKSDSFWF